MGARPIAMLNSLRFGSLDTPRDRYLSPASCAASATTATASASRPSPARSMFDPAYAGNPLVNAMCVGLLREEELIRAAAQGVGNPIIAVGARTGRDGIHGASFASEDLSRRERGQAPARAGRRSVHREAAARGEPRADPSAATSSRSRTWARPASRRRRPRWPRAATSASRSTRARCRSARPGMTPYEILLTESQERMLVVATARPRGRRCARSSRSGTSPRR